MNERLIATLNLTKRSNIAFLLWENMLGQVTDVKFMTYLDQNNQEKIPVGAMVVKPDIFIAICKIIDQHVDELANSEPREIADIPVSKRQIIRISVTMHEGRTGIDIRKFYPGGDEWSHGPSGIRVPLKLRDKLLECLDKVRDAIK